MAVTLKGIKQLEPGKWRVFASIADSSLASGRKEVKRIVHGTLADAQEERAQLLDELRAGRDVGRSTRQTLSGYARSWLELRTPTIAAATADKYVKALNHILRELGDLYVDAARPADVKRFVASQLEEYAPVTVAGRLRVLRTMAADAVADGVCDRDFTARIPLPQAEGYTDEEPNLLRGDELDRVLAAVPEQWLPAVQTMACTGLRWSEMGPLTWEDVDLEAGTLRVRKSNFRGQVGKPKTRRSRRVIALVPELVDVLKEHRRQMVAAQHPGLEKGLVFPTRKGTLYRSWPLVRVLRQAMKAAGIERRLTPHGLRRTWNDLLDRVAARRVTQAIIGHTSDRMTDHYGRVDVEELRAAQVLALKEARGE